MADALEDIVRDRRVIRASLAATLARTRRISSELSDVVARNGPHDIPPLLAMAEGLIAAHKAALLVDDGYAFDLIQDALRHVGRRLEIEAPSWSLKAN